MEKINTNRSKKIYTTNTKANSEKNEKNNSQINHLKVKKGKYLRNFTIENFRKLFIS